jgi:hypothetical protein
MITPSTLDDPVLLFGNDHRQFTVDIEFRNFIDSDNDTFLWNHSKNKVQDSLSRQVKLCAEFLLTPAGKEANSDAARYLRTCIWEIVRAAPHVYIAGEPENNEPYLFALGDDLCKCAFNKDGEIAVIAHTNLAFPLDPNGHAFNLPIPKNYWFSFPYRWKGVSVAPKKPLFEPRWEPCLVRKAEDALNAVVDPAVVVWCLEHQENKLGSVQLENGRRYISLSSCEMKQRESVRKEHDSKLSDFRGKAVNACIAKWGRVIDPKTITGFFAKLETNGKYDRNGEPVVDEKGEPIKNTLHLTNVHHNTPVYFGGNNEIRTYTERKTHQDIIHADFDHTIGRVSEALGVFGKNKFKPELLREDLLSHPGLVERLKRIPNVRVEDYKISVGILWPQEIYFIPSLLHFEIQNGGIYGPDDEGYKASSLQRPLFTGETRKLRASSVLNT